MSETRDAAEYLEIKRLEQIANRYLEKNKTLQVEASQWWDNMTWAYNNLRSGNYDLTDLTLICKSEDENETTEEKVKCHALILTSYCKYFYNILLGKVESKAKKTMTITIEDATKRQMEGILRFIYTREFDIHLDDVVSVWILANKFLLEDLQIECESTVMKNVRDDNVEDILNIAKMVDSQRVIERCKDLKDSNK